MNMKAVFFNMIFFAVLMQGVSAQRKATMQDSISQRYLQNHLVMQSGDAAMKSRDSLLQIYLVYLVKKNPAMIISSATVAIAQSEQRKARSSWLGTLHAGGNINEFVVNNSPVSSFYPKYNVGLNLPFNTFSNVKTSKEIAKQNLIVSEETKKERSQILTAEVLGAFEIYKEKSELMRLVKTSVETEYQSYLIANQKYNDGTIEMDVMTRGHQLYILEQAKMITLQKDLNIAILQIEQLIGISLEKAYAESQSYRSKQ